MANKLKLRFGNIIASDRREKKGERRNFMFE
jgi:hypothetical protein